MLTSLFPNPSGLSNHFNHTHKQPSSHPSAHDTHITDSIKLVSHSASQHLLPPPPPDARAHSLLSARALRRVSRSCNHTSKQPTSYPICPRHMHYIQDEPRQSLSTSPPSPIANVKLTSLLTSKARDIHLHPAHIQGLSQCTSSMTSFNTQIFPALFSEIFR